MKFVPLSSFLANQTFNHLRRYDSKTVDLRTYDVDDSALVDLHGQIVLPARPTKPMTTVVPEEVAHVIVAFDRHTYKA